MKEQLDLKTSHNKALHAKQEELRAYARELKERAETLYTAKGEAMPQSLLNPPVPLKEMGEVSKS